MKPNEKTASPTSSRSRRPHRAETTRAEAALIDGVLLHDQAAWKEFVAHFNPLLAHVVRRTLATSIETVLPSDAVDDILGEFYLEVLERDLYWLRTWAQSTRRARLGTWLAQLVKHIAIDHYRSVAASTRLPKRAARVEVDTDDERARRWVGMERDAAEGVREAGESSKRSRRRKTVADELRPKQGKRHLQRMSQAAAPQKPTQRTS